MGIKIVSLIVALGIATGAQAASHGAAGGGFFESWDMNGDGQVMMPEVNIKREQIFTQFDANSDGHMDTAEFAEFAAFQRGLENAQTDRTQRLILQKAHRHLDIQSMDGDQDGMVSKSEFLFSGAEWFQGLDIDYDGNVTLADFKHLQPRSLSGKSLSFGIKH